MNTFMQKWENISRIQIANSEDQRVKMSHPSCIKMPADAKSTVYQRPFDNLDQISTRNDLTSMADEIFGVNNWSHGITNQTIDFTKCRDGAYFVGCSAIVRVQLANGTFHEDMGYSNSNAMDEGLAIFSARSGSITNALRNTLLCFGGAIAAKIRDFQRLKTEQTDSHSCLSISTIDGAKKIVTLPKTKTILPNAQSTPQKSPAVKNNNKEIPRCHEQTKNDGNKIKLEIQPTDTAEPMVITPACSKPMENAAKINKPVLSTDEERRLERKRRQAQLQEEFRKMHKDREATEKPNARF